MLDELTKRVESGEKKIEANDKKVETYNSRVDQIPGAPPVLEGLDAKKFVQKPFSPSAAPKPIPKKFHMPEIPKYNGTTDPNEHVTSYTCVIKGNDLEGDEIEFFGKARAKYTATTCADVHNRYQSKIRVEDGQFGASSESIYPTRTLERIKRDIDREPRSNGDRYRPYNEDWRRRRSGRNHVRNERRNDRGINSRGIITKNGFDRSIGPKGAPRILEHNFSIDAAAIVVSAIGQIKDAKWPRPLQSDLAQRDLHQVCKYHGTHGHRMEDCRQLREEVARVFNNGHLQEFLSD
ncbi:PREDICTED: uncharacterized protein LOC109236046 [Nicotiana attenuata]|uniref:uncharacterized protein LOC109236046 n=1 Tax=Nicotiana attenuata TaxID=49451 RepID=UPI000904BDA8|nr:PREDICTED: uncharacterized protein LOC109236046 [Nicotiana attenuata]